MEGLRGSDTTTHWLQQPGDPQGVGAVVVPGTLEIRGASTHNLKDVDVDIPRGVLCVVTAHRRVRQELPLIHRCRRPRRSGGGRSVRCKAARDGAGQPALDCSSPILAFAKANGVKPALFSSNSEGACPT